MDSSTLADWSNHLHVRVLDMGISLLGDWWRFQFSRVGHWRFYTHEGNGASLQHRGENYPLQQGRLYLISKGVQAFSTACSSTANVRQFHIHFDVLGLPDIALDSIFAQPICLPPSDSLEKTVQDTIANIHANEPAFIVHCRIKAILYEGLALYLSSLRPDELEICQHAVLRLAPILPALKYIENRFATSLNNALLAQECNMSEDYFIRRFKACTGQSPGQYTMQFRLRLVAQRLLFTQVGIEQIALETGFCHRSHLTKAFRNHFGVSPHVYRNNAG